MFCFCIPHHKICPSFAGDRKFDTFSGVIDTVSDHTKISLSETASRVSVVIYSVSFEVIGTVFFHNDNIDRRADGFNFLGKTFLMSSLLDPIVEAIQYSAD